MNILFICEHVRRNIFERQWKKMLNWETESECIVEFNSHNISNYTLETSLRNMLFVDWDLPSLEIRSKNANVSWISEMKVYKTLKTKVSRLQRKIYSRQGHLESTIFFVNRAKPVFQNWRRSNCSVLDKTIIRTVLNTFQTCFENGKFNDILRKNCE